MATIELVVKIAGWTASLGTILIGGVSVIKALQCLLRHDITDIYYKHKDEENPTLREYERKNLDALVEGYFAIRGNHFVKDIYTEMRTWNIEN